MQSWAAASKPGQCQSKRSIFVPKMWHCETKHTRKRKWDKRNGVKEIVEKPTILTVIVMMNVEIAFLMKERGRVLKCIKNLFN